MMSHTSPPMNDPIFSIERTIRQWMSSQGVPEIDHDCLMSKIKTNINLVFIAWENDITTISRTVLSAIRQFATTDILDYVQDKYPEQMNFFASVFGYYDL